ncbi:MAG: ATP-binding protein [Bacteroidota bacterium]
MKIRTKYILFIVLLHLTTLVMSFFIFRENKLVFVASELIILLSLYFSYQLYQSLVGPVQLIAKGTNAIRERDFHVKFQKVGGKEMDQLITVYNSMIDELRKERRANAQKHFLLEKLIKTSPTGMLLLDLNGHVSNCNPKAATLLQLKEEELLGKALQEFDHPLLQSLGDLPPDSTQTIQLNGIETYKCHKAHFIDQGFANHFLLIEELTAEKLAIEKQAYGKVIRMMAHEVNNSIGPINSILSSLDHHRVYLPKEEQQEFQYVLKVAIDRNLKLRDFMENFANVVRLPSPSLVSTDLRELIQDITSFMVYEPQASQIDFHWDLPERPFLLQIDPRQMEQVLINIIKNGIEAIEGEGSIRIHLNEGKRSLQVIDSGKGIAETEAAQVFAPFFTTKPQGQGVGLTLVREVLMNHGFEFSLSSNEEGETVFEIVF